MSKILIVSDSPNWSYSVIANSLLPHAPPDIEVDHISLKGGDIKKIYKKYSLFFVMGWQMLKKLEFLPKKYTLTGVHSHQSFDNRKTTPDKNVDPPIKIIKFLNEFAGVNVVSERLYNIFKKYDINIFYTPNGVDSEMFFPKNKRTKFHVGTAGSLKNDWNKGVNEIIKPACQESNIILKTAMREAGYIKHKNMPDFYNSISVYISASNSEGMPISILEAASCGCVVISTNCGDISKLVIDGETGFIVKRNKLEIINKIKQLKEDKSILDKMSFSIRKKIECEWDWKYRAKFWFDFLKENLN